MNKTLLIGVMFLLVFTLCSREVHADWSSNNTFTATNPYLFDSNGGCGYFRGAWIFAKNNARIVQISTTQSNVVYCLAYVSNSTYTCNATSVSTHSAEFDCNISAGSYYYVSASSSDKFWFYYNPPVYNYSSTDFDVIGTVQGANPNTLSHQTEIYMGGPEIITSQTLIVQQPTSTTLYFNGSYVPDGYVSNVTYGAGGNTTAVVNVTDLNVSILINGWLVATGTTSAEIVGVLGAGYYNLTGYTDGNSSFSASSSTYFANISKATPTLNIIFNTSDTVVEGTPVLVTCSDTVSLNLYNDTSSISNPTTLNTSSLSGLYNFTCNTTGNANYTSATTNRTLNITVTPPPFTSNATFSYSACYDNVTLLTNSSVYHNGVLNNTVEFIGCPNGCDNVTLSCSPDRLIVDLETAGIIIGFLIIAGIFAWWIV